jgi:type I restriction enzyme M protein
MSLQRHVALLVEEAAKYRSKIAGFYADAEAEMLERLGWAKLTKQRTELWYVQNYHALTTAGRCDAEHFRPQLRRLRKHLVKEGSKSIGEFCPTPRRGVQPVFVQNGDVWVIDSKAVRPGGPEPSLEERTNLAFLNDPRNAKAGVAFGDVLLNSTGRGTLGRAACWLRHEPAMADNHVSILRPDPHDCLPVYMALFLNSPAGMAQTEMFQTGSSGQLELYSADVLKLIVYLPKTGNGNIDLEWQRKLTNKVIAANEANITARAKIEEAKSLVEGEIKKSLKLVLTCNN